MGGVCGMPPFRPVIQILSTHFQRKRGFPFPLNFARIEQQIASGNSRGILEGFHLNIMHLVNALPGVAAQGLIWGIMAIGVYITFRILDVADLTVDGTMATGGAAFIMLTMAGAPVPLAMLGAFLAGVLAGLVTGLFHTACGIPAILAGILTQLALYSVNLRIMGQANRPVSSRQYDLLVDQQSVRSLSLDNPILVVAIFVAAVIALGYGAADPQMPKRSTVQEIARFY